MADLHWFPFFVADWLSSPSVIAMLPEQRGAFIQLLAVAWGNGTAEPSLEIDERKLASLSGLGTRWKRLGSVVRDEFVERNGRLYNEKLSTVWADQQAKYEKYAKAGKKGGQAKGKGKRRSSDAVAMLKQLPSDGLAKAKQSESETTAITLTELLPVVPPDGALALDAPRTSAGFATIRDAIQAAPDPPRESLRERLNRRHVP